MSQITFRSGVELGKFASSIDIIPEAYLAVSKTISTYELHTSRSGIKVLAFNCSPDYTTRFLEGEFGLVSSENLKVLDFIPTKVNASFFINKAAVGLFQDLGDDLKELENKHINTSLVITGSGLGGYLAVLFTLHLHHAIDAEESNASNEKKRPLCITFGTPLVGDAALQRAISERPQWKSSFLNLVAKEDHVASFFALKTTYKPLGTFLFCTESGGHAAFEDEDSILPVLDAIQSSNASELKTYDYTKVLSSIRKKLLYRGVTESSEFKMNLLRAGITLQLREVGLLDSVLNDHIEEMEKKQIKMIKCKNQANSYDHVKNLNERKISMIYMEWYMKTRDKTMGYYDAYKAEIGDENMSKQEIVTPERRLYQYWKKIVEDTDLMPPKEGEKLRKRWLLAGNNYRWIVEPLYIARYYCKDKKVNYMDNRANHFKLLEKWLNEHKKSSNLSEEKKNKAASLTEDSCFWAHVEEAIILLRDLVRRGSADDEKKLENFEAYVMCAIKNYSVSPDVFLEKSSLMKWWNEYKAYKGSAYSSEFAQFMNNKTYESYK